MSKQCYSLHCKTFRVGWKRQTDDQIVTGIVFPFVFRFLLMMASDNILKPADGHTVTMPSQDMILGLYYLTTVIDGAKGQGRVFSSLEEAEMALDKHEIDMQAKVLIRLPQDFVLPKDWEPSELKVVDPEPGSPDVVKEERFHDGSVLFATSYGRILFNSTLPLDYPFVNDQAPKKRLSKIVDDIATRYPTAQVAATLDALKDMGFTRAPWSGVSFAFSDVIELHRACRRGLGWSTVPRRGYRHIRR